MRAYIFHSAWKPQAAAFSTLMLAKATLLAVGLFLAWPDKWSEVCVCVISSTCDFASSHFAFWVCFFYIFFFFFFIFMVFGQWISKMAECVFNGWDSQCCCQLVSVESHCCVRKDALRRRSICPKSLMTIWVWFGPVSIHSTPEGSLLQSLNL